MRRRGRWCVMAALALGWLAVAGSVAAKEGVKATLVGTFPVDAAPGSSVVLVADFWVEDPYHGRAPVYGSPVGIRLVDVHGATTEALGAELEAKRGRYRFEMAMPPGRVIAVRAFMRGTSDLPIAFAPDPLTPATSTLPEPPAPPPDGPLPALAPAAAGIAAGLLLLVRLRRRQPRAT